jgi:hypothetical protein
LAIRIAVIPNVATLNAAIPSAAIRNAAIRIVKVLIVAIPNVATPSAAIRIVRVPNVATPNVATPIGMVLNAAVISVLIAVRDAASLVRVDQLWASRAAATKGPAL